MTRVLKNPWLVAMIGVVAYGSTTALVFPRPELLQRRTLARWSEAGLRQHNGPSWLFKNPELEQMLIELRDEKKALATRQQQLAEWESRLHAERQEILAVTQTVYSLQRELDQTIVRVREEETANLKKLAKVYAGMAPEAAANILKEMPDEQVVSILVGMREAEASPILESLGRTGREDAKRAALISNRIRLSVSRNGPAKAKSP